MSAWGDIVARERMVADAFVYICGSRSLHLIKVGWSKGEQKTLRVKTLNKDGYAGATDWLLLYERKYKNSGRVEFDAHTKLRSYIVRSDYERLAHGVKVRAQEVFCCNYEDAFTAVESTNEEALEARYERPENRGNFNYRI